MDENGPILVFKLLIAFLVFMIVATTFREWLMGPEFEENKLKKRVEIMQKRIEYLENEMAK